MVEMSKKDFFKIEDAHPEEGDLEWRHQFEGKMVRMYGSALKKAVQENSLYRVQYLLNTYPNKYKKLDKSTTDSFYHPIHLIAMRNDALLPIVQTLLNNTDFEYPHQKETVVEAAFLSNNTIYAESVFKYFNDYLMLGQETTRKHIISQILETGHSHSLTLFIDAGVDVDDPTHQMLAKSISNGRLNNVRMLVEKYDVTITEDHISEAERVKQYEIAAYLRDVTEPKPEEAPLVANETQTVEKAAPKQEIIEKPKNMSSWQLVGEDAIMHIRNSEDGAIKVTDLYDFSQQNVTRSQYLMDLNVPPTVQTTKFSDLDGTTSVLQAFNQLAQKLGKEPPIKMVPEAAPEQRAGPQKLSISKFKN